MLGPVGACPMLRRRLTVGAACLALWVSAAVPVQSPAPLFRQIESILAELAEISGLHLRKPVQYDLISRAGLRRFLEQRVREEIRPEEIRAEELTLKKFGFVPADFDLKKTMVELLTEQAAAFYDFRRKKLFVLESASEMLQQMALVHELAHALADQHFNLEKFIDRARTSDDMALARLAVMEGQATWLMSEFVARRTGQSLRTSPGILQFMSQSAALSAGQFPVFDGAPLYLRESLLFPYSKGMLFQHAVVERYGKEAFAFVFRNPPTTTQQILHPEAYFEPGKPSVPVLPRLATERQYRELTAGTIGELDHWILLRQYVSDEVAETVAPQWRGGRYRLLQNKKSGRLVLLYASEWSNASAAADFFRFYRRVLQGKWKALHIALDTETRLAGAGDDGHFRLTRQATRVESIEGLESPSEAPIPPGEVGYTENN
jgi:hypothetical protein